jgi:hypothetical protein
MTAPLSPETLAQMDEAHPGWRAWTAQRRLDLARRYEAGTAGETAAQKREKLLVSKFGSVEAAPVFEQAQLSDLRGERRSGPPKAIPPISVADLQKNAQAEVEAIDRRVSELSKRAAGESVNVTIWKAAEVQRLQDRAAGIRRRFS